MSERRPTTDDEGATDPRHGTDRSAIKPEYEEAHPSPPPTSGEEISVADLRPEVEGETIPERAHRQADSAG